MSRESLLIFFADAILIIHVIFVLFVIVGLVAIYIGRFFNWLWIHNRWFRITHLAAILIVVVQSWVGAICPLTTWEMELREAAGSDTYSGSFVQYWLQALLYYTAPDWVFILLYTSFGCLGLLGWLFVRPNPSGKNE